MSLRDQFGTSSDSLLLDDAGNSTVTAQLVFAPALASFRPSVDAELAKLNQQIHDEAARYGLGVDTDIKVLTFDLREYQNGGRTITAYADIDTSIMRCEVRARLTLAGKLPDVRPKDAGSKADCRAGGFIAKQLIPFVEARAVTALRDGINKAKVISPDTLSEWMKLDPDWGAFVAQASLDTFYCDAAGGAQALCVQIRWPDADAFSKYGATLVAKAPKPTGAASGNSALRDQYIKVAEEKDRKASTRVPGLKYPAEILANGTFNDFDMTLFGGLLCAAKESNGCALVKNSQGADGRFWRSPDRVDVAPPPDGSESTFSGDAFNGIVIYLVATGNVKAFRDYVGYLSNHQQSLFGVSFHKSCMDDKAYQCAIAGGEWFWLNRLAEKLQVVDAIPADLRNPEKLYGFDLDTLRWQALLVPAGYRLHLTGIGVWMAQKLGLDSPTLHAATAILAARQPQNPFFLYLQLGMDKAAQEATDAVCDVNRVQAEYTDWAWQRATEDKAWLRSMRWDCVFMYRLLDPQ